MKPQSLPQLLPQLLPLLLAIGFMTTACGRNDTDFALLPAAEQFQQSNDGFNNKLDIVFVINDQPSMSSFQDELVTSMSTFMQVFETKGFDFKIAVVTSAGYMADPTLNGYSAINEAKADFNDFNGTQHSGFPILLPTDLDLYAHFAINAKPAKNTSGQDGRAFSSFRQALSSTRTTNAGFLRPDSYLAVIIVDNQDDFSGNARCAGCNVSGRYNASTLDPVSTYVDFLNTLTGTSGGSARYSVSAMTQSVAPCQGGALMTRIMELVSLTKGVTGDICQADFGASMLDISSNIATLSTQFFLDRQPVPGSIRVLVDGVSVPEDATNGWTYSSEANSVQFHGTAIPPQGAIIAVDFEPTSIM